MIHSPVRWGIGAAGCALLAACSSSSPTQVVTVTTTHTPSVTTPTTVAAPSTSASSTHSPSATQQTELPGTCQTLLDDSAVFSAVGVRTLPGEDEFVVGKAEPDIHRLAYLNCRYGVTGRSGTPAVEIGISLYATAGYAARRITATVDDYTAHGASSSTTQVLGQQASVLTGGTGSGYDVPTLVVADGQRTVAVSIAASVTPAARFTHSADAVARLALQRTAP